MANYNSKILTTAVSSLHAQQAAIATTANNIANVNTPGYSRRTLELETRATDSLGSGLNLGNGVEIGGLVRRIDSFLVKLVREAAGADRRYAAEDAFLARLEPLFAFEGDFLTIGSALNSFYAAMNDLALNPSDLSLRANVIQQAENLVESIHTTYNTLAQLQTDADLRIETEINTINAITAQIAELNGAIRTRESTGNLAADERDQRDHLLEKLAEKMSFSVTELSDGTVTISLANGFALVTSNTSRALEFNRTPSFAVGGVPQSLAGGNLGYIVYDHSQGGGTSHQDLTSLFAAGDGSIGGLLRMRGTIDADASLTPFDANGVLPELAARVESLTRTLLVDFNYTYYAPNAAGNPTSGDLNSNPPQAFGLFSWIGNPNRDGPAVTIGDLDPAITGKVVYSSILNVVPTRAERICAGRDPTGTSPPVVPKGDGSNARAMAGLRTRSFLFEVGGFSPVSYTHLTLPTIYSV